MSSFALPLEPPQTTTRQSSTSSWWRCFHPRLARGGKIGGSTHRTAADFQTCSARSGHDANSWELEAHRRTEVTRDRRGSRTVVDPTSSSIEPIKFEPTTSISFVHTTPRITDKRSEIVYLSDDNSCTCKHTITVVKHKRSFHSTREAPIGLTLRARRQDCRF